MHPTSNAVGNQPVGPTENSVSDSEKWQVGPELKLILISLFVLSGFSGLIYEAVWGRYLRFLLGNSAEAQTFVIAVFMGGMGIGSWISSRYSTRWKSLLLAYALIEIAIGAFALTFHFLFENLTEWAFSSAIPAIADPVAIELFKQSLALAMILPPSILLGLTFPLMSGGILRLFPSKAGATLSALYFSNSIGAACGVLATGFVLVKISGLPGTIMIAGVISLVIGMFVLVLSKQVEEPALEITQSATVSSSQEKVDIRILLFVAAFTGLASFIYEIAWIRMLSMILGSSSHAFELMLATFIAGLAFGGLWIKQRIEHLQNTVLFLARVQWVMGLLALITIVIYNYCFDVMKALMFGLARTDEGYVLFNIGSNLLAVAVMFPAAFCAGTTLPLITHTLLKQGQGERSVGRVYAYNTFGAIVGVLFATHIGLPMLSLKGTLFFGAIIDIAAGLYLYWLCKRTLTRIPTMAAAAATGALVLVVLTVQFDPLKMASSVYRNGGLLSPDDNVSIFQKDGKSATVAVLDNQSRRVILTNGKPDASISLDPDGKPTADESTQNLLAVIPLAAVPDAKNAAVIGFGSGMTSAALLGSESLESVDTVEIEKAMVEGARLFQPRNNQVFDDPRSNVIIADARTFFSAHQKSYDIIISEPSNPWVSGVASMFSDEFYQKLVKHLNEGGVFAQWLHLYELSPTLVASVINALSRTFEDYTIFATSPVDMVILARRGGPVGPLSEAVFETPVIKDTLAKHGIYDRNMLESHRVGDSQAMLPLLASFNAPVNSEYFPYLDLNAAKSRFLQHNAGSLMNVDAAGIAVTEMVGKDAGYRSEALAVDRLSVSDTQHISIQRVVQTMHATQIGRYFLSLEKVEQDPLPKELDRSMRYIYEKSIICGSKGGSIKNLVSALVDVGSAITPHLDAQTLGRIWAEVQGSACYGALPKQAHRWIEFFRAAGTREADKLLAAANELYASAELSLSRRTLVLSALMVGLLDAGQPSEVVDLWDREYENYAGQMPVTIRLLVSHAKLGVYADRYSIAESETDP